MSGKTSRNQSAMGLSKILKTRAETKATSAFAKLNGGLLLLMKRKLWSPTKDNLSDSSLKRTQTFQCFLVNVLLLKR